MNYVSHSRAAFNLLMSAPDATPHHISLYVVLFTLWNEARFPKFILLFKDDVMEAAHIGSPKTYRACLRDLTDWGLITYQPSQSEHRASRAIMHTLDAVDPVSAGAKVSQAVPKSTHSNRSKSDPSARAKCDPSPTQAMPSIDKQGLNTSKLNKENSTPFSRTAAAPEKKMDGFLAKDQHSEQSHSNLTSSSAPKEKVALKRKATEMPKRQHAPEISFNESELANVEKFIAAFDDTTYALANLRYYHELIANWRQDGQPPLRRDWMATARKFMLNDIQDGKLKLANSPTSSRGTTSPLSSAEFGAAIDEYANGRYA
jgi:hypothetical protein